MIEKLKVLDLFAGHTICEDGKVITRLGRIAKLQISRNGYARVELWVDGKGRKYLLHRLLAKTFIPNPKNKPQVNHIDGNKLNNNLSNLEWVDQSENQLHAYKNGLQKGYKKPCRISESHKNALCGSRWKYEKHIYKLDENSFDNLWDAAKHFGVSRQTVLNRCKSEKYPQWTKSIEREGECQRS